MKLFTYLLNWYHRRATRRRWVVLGTCITALCNMAMVITLLASVSSFKEQNREFTDIPVDATVTSTIVPLKESYDYYLRIDYVLDRSTCKSMGAFNDSYTIASLERMVRK